MFSLDENIRNDHAGVPVLVKLTYFNLMFPFSAPRNLIRTAVYNVRKQTLKVVSEDCPNRKWFRKTVRIDPSTLTHFALHYPLEEFILFKNKSNNS